MVKYQELQDKSSEEIDELFHTLKKEIFELRGKRIGSKGDKTHLIGHKKKVIARILTLKTERELSETKN